MDNEKKQQAPQHTRADDTMRLDPSDPQATRRQDAVKRQGTFDMEKLRRDLEESKRLHEEAKRHNQLKQARQKQAEASFTAAQQAANHKRVAQQTPPPQAAPDRAKQRAAAQENHAAQEKSVHAQKKHQEKGQAKEKVAAFGAMAGKKMAAYAEKKKKGERKPLHKRRGCGCLLYVILFFVVIGIAFATLWAVRAHNAATPIDQIPASDRAAVAMEREKSNVYLLLAGTDQRADEASRSDTIIYTALRPVDRKIEMVSIPRDSLVEIPGVGEDKVNASLAYGGMDLLKETVENLTDSPVDHTVLINFDSFADIIDAMGGITINVEEDMYLPEEGIDLKAGEQKLDGHDALAFVRWRGDGTGDIGRMQRQSQFMQALSEKVRHLTPWRAAMTLWTVSHEIETDMSMLDMLKLAWDFIGMGSDALEYQSFQYETPYINGISYVILDEQSVNDVIQTMRYGTVLDSTTNGYY